MASLTENILKHYITDGVIAVKAGHSIPLKYIRAIEAGHPLPDNNSVIAANEIKALMQKATSKDLVIFLLSGGASSLMTDLPGGCSLNELNIVFDALLKSGATIEEMNCVRKHLSSIKGGQLAKLASGARIVSFIISDVIGDDISVIGSGPTVPDTSTFADAMNILQKSGLVKILPYCITERLNKGMEGIISETPKPGDPAFKNTSNYIIADNSIALEAAKKQAADLGYEAHIITRSLNGLAEEAAKDWINKARSYTQKKQCLIAGGETTVMIKGNGKGGRNQQFALTAAIAIKEDSHLSLLAAGTDGSDGPTDATGAIINCDTYMQARDMGIIAEDYLENNDAYHFFEKIGGLLKTGPTQTNVMDIVITLID
jgi:glycerate-2-kinase